MAPCSTPNPKTKRGHHSKYKGDNTHRDRGGVELTLPERVCVCVLFSYDYRANKLASVRWPSSLTSCCRLQPPAPARCRTGWHRSRAPAPTRWRRRPSSGPRPSSPAPCPRLLLGGPPACFRYEEVGYRGSGLRSLWVTPWGEGGSYAASPLAAPWQARQANW